MYSTKSPLILGPEPNEYRGDPLPNFFFRELGALVAPKFPVLKNPALIFNNMNKKKKNKLIKSNVISRLNSFLNVLNK